MASIKVKLRKDKQKKDGTFPIIIQLIKDGVPKRIPLGHSILELDWDDKNKVVKKSHPNSKRLNNLLAQKLAEANDKLLEAETSSSYISAQDLKQKIKHSDKGASFFEVAGERIKLKHAEEVYSVATRERSMLYNIQEFLNFQPHKTCKAEIMQRRKQRAIDSRKNPNNFLKALEALCNETKLAFIEINAAFLKNFKSFCKTYLDHVDRTISNHLIFIRTNFNTAIRENLVEAEHYPFAGDKEKITLKSGHKIGLTKKEVERIEALDLEPGTQIWHTKHVWLFAFYFAGIRISDVVQMQWSDFKDGRLFYTMNKNEKPVSLKIPEKAKAILKHYRDDARSIDDFIFPHLKLADKLNAQDVYIKSRNATSLLNKYLKRIAKLCDIDKPLSNHIARHTFGNIAKGDVDPYVLQKLYRHSDLKTTINYQANFIHKEADDALDNIVS